jgi:UDP-N-acetyl-D-glucosamine dehydrogenase
MDYKQQLLSKINNGTAVIGIIGLGYVGLPLALEFAKKEFTTIGFDIDERKIPILMRGESYIKHISADRIQKSVSSKKFKATSDFSLLTSCDAIIICVPTPLDEHREPDMTYIENSAKIVAQYLQPGQLVTLESSTYPGTTEEILLPLFNEALSHLTKGGDTEGGQEGAGSLFFLAFSPEREDPNNPDFSTSTIPKVVGGVTPNCLEVACALYDKVIVKTIPVSSPRAAEATKLLENIYRSINIALVNELKMVFDRMDIDVWEVIEAAKTKPFGFHAFYPGPGLGGHCIPIDPFYLTWKAREFDINTKFIELAGEVNTFQPYYVVQKMHELLDGRRKTLKESCILIIGASYKKNIDDMRESPTLKLIEILRQKGAVVDYHDPYVPKLPKTRKYNYEMESVPLTSERLSSYDLVLISTDHDNINYELIIDNCELIIDTRNVFERKGIKSEKVFKA